MHGVHFRLNVNQDAFDGAIRHHLEALMARKIQAVRFLEAALGRPPQANPALGTVKSGDPREVARNIRLLFKLNERADSWLTACGLVEASGITVLTIAMRREGFFGLSIDDHAPGEI
jgi:hypothetical protein